MPSRRACSSLLLSGQTLKTFEFEVTDHLTPCQADGPNLTAIPEEMRTGPSPRAMPSLSPPAAEAGRAMSLPVMSSPLRGGHARQAEGLLRTGCRRPEEASARLSPRSFGLLPLRRKQSFLLAGPRVLPFPPNACISPKAIEASFKVTPKTVPLLKTTHLTPPVGDSPQATVESRFTAARALTARSLRSVGLKPEQASETPARLVETPAPGPHLPEVWMGPENLRL